MFFILGFTVLLASIFLGFIGGGGNIWVMVQPFEILIVCGSACGIFVISNPPTLQKQIWHNLKKTTKSGPYTAKDYLETLTFLFYFLRFVRSNSALSVEKHIENPNTSHLFRSFPRIASNKAVVIFICDYMRVVTMGCDNVYELERMIDEDLQVRHRDLQESTYALSRIADALPALGIIGAVLGVINAMSAINSEPVVLAYRIAAALMGTFLGVFLSYGIISPLGFCIEKYGKDELRLMECIKCGIISFIRGQPPMIAVEFARQSIPLHFKPSFIEVERVIKKSKPRA